MYAAVPTLSAPKPLLVVAALATSAAVASGCASDAPRRRNRMPQVDASAAAAPPPLGPWAHFGELPSFTEAGYAAHSAHRLGDDAATILRNSKANASIDAEQPEGAILVAALAPGRDAPANEFFVMEKGGEGAAAETGGWAFLVVGPDGQTHARGVLPLCVRCHQEAGPRLVFPVSAPAPMDR